MAERQFDFDFTDDSIGTVRILAMPIAGGGGGGGSGTDDRVDLINGSATYPLMSVTKATVSGVSGVIWKYDDGTTDGLNVFVADGTGLNTVKSAIEAQLSLFGTYTEGASTVDAIAVSISLTYAQITTAVSNGRQVYLSNGINTRFAYVGTHAVNGTTSHVFSEVECAVNQSTGDTNGTLRTIVYPSSGSAYMYDLALKPVKSTITASDTNPVNSVAVASYAQPLTDKVSVSGTSVTQALDADKMYVFGEVTALTVTLNTSSDSSHVHEYHFRFTSGTTATTLTLPSGVTMPSDFTVEASKTYEISIVDGYGAYVAW